MKNRFFQWLQNIQNGDNLKKYAQNIQPLQPKIELKNVQTDINGQVLENPVNPVADNKPGIGTKLKYKVKNAGSGLSNALFGEQLQTPTIDTHIENLGDDARILSGISLGPRQGGLLRDIAGGFNENFHDNFSIDNLNNRFTDDGMKKGFAFRIGEGLGSAAKLANSPLGRGVLTAGAIGVFGGSPLEMAAYGAKAAVGNQQNVMRDKMYRESLANMGLDTSNINGYIDDKAYQNYTLSNYRNNSLAVRSAIAGASDNTKRANLIMQGLNNGSISPEEAKFHMQNYGISFDDLQKSNTTRNADINQELAPARKYALYTAPQVALGNLGINQARLKEQMQQNDFNNHIKAAEIVQKQQEKTSEFDDIEKQLNNFEATFASMPSKAESYTFGRVREKTGTQTEKEANFNAQRTLLFNQIARKLGGEKGVLSDFDIQRIEAALPKLTDSLEQKNAKMKAVYDLLEIRKGVSKKNDPLGIR